VLRLQDVFNVALHLDCFLKLALGVEPATLGLVPIPLAEGVREDGLGLGSIVMRVHSSPFASVSSAGSSCRSSASSIVRPKRVFAILDKGLL
jgi:hypothetical protein